MSCCFQSLVGDFFNSSAWKPYGMVVGQKRARKSQLTGLVIMVVWDTQNDSFCLVLVDSLATWYKSLR